MSLRSPLSRVTGLGSAKDGTSHWWAERVSSIALVPLTLWLVFSLVTLPSLDYATVKTWMSFPLTAFLCALLVFTAAYHSYLGTTVVVEDYAHSPGTRLLLLVSLKFAHILAGGAGIFAILRVAFGA
jgi:succinate dehydrogenase / fumarate reductase membrane anchor subunit